MDLWNNGWKHLLYYDTDTPGWLFQAWPGDKNCSKVEYLGGGSVGLHLEGVTTVPLDSRYGMLSDSVICGAQYNNRLYWVTASNPNSWNWVLMGCPPEDLAMVNCS